LTRGATRYARAMTMSRSRRDCLMIGRNERSLPNHQIRLTHYVECTSRDVTLSSVMGRYNVTQHKLNNQYHASRTHNTHHVFKHDNTYTHSTTPPPIPPSGHALSKWTKSPRPCQIPPKLVPTSCTGKEYNACPD
jgi:hypothetical protein